MKMDFFDCRADEAGYGVADEAGYGVADEAKIGDFLGRYAANG